VQQDENRAVFPAEDGAGSPGLERLDLNLTLPCLPFPSLPFPSLPFPRLILYVGV